MHVTKVYFIQLVLKIIYVEFEDKPYLKTENVKIFTARSLLKTSYPKNEKYEHWTTFCEVVNNRFDRTHFDDWLKIGYAVYTQFCQVVWRHS